MNPATHLAFSSALAFVLATSACGHPAPATPTPATAPTPAAAPTPAPATTPAPAPATAAAPTELSPLDRANAVSGHLTAGRNAIDAKLWDTAISEFDGAIALDARNARAFAGRAFAKMHKGLSVADADNDFVKAIEIASPNTDEASRKLRGGALFNRGLIAEAAGDKPRAMQLYKEAYDVWPNKAVGQKLGLPPTP